MATEVAVQAVVYDGGVAAAGTDIDLTTDPTKATRTTDAHARFYDAVRQGKVFLAANQAGSAITNLASVATGFILYNPVNSGKNLVLLEITFLQTSTAAAAANAGVQLAANVNPSLGAPTSTTPLTVRNALLGNQSVSVGQAFSAATIGAAPVAIRQLWQPSVSATATTGIPPTIKDLVDGLVLVGPGCCVSLSALAALSGATGMMWEDVNV